MPKLRSKLGPNADEVGPRSSTTTQKKARRTKEIDFLQLPWAQEVRGSNPRAPTTHLLIFSKILRRGRNAFAFYKCLRVRCLFCSMRIEVLQLTHIRRSQWSFTSTCFCFQRASANKVQARSGTGSVLALSTACTPRLGKSCVPASHTMACKESRQNIQSWSTMPGVLVVCGTAFAGKRLLSILRSLPLPDATSLCGLEQGFSFLVVPEKNK